MRVVSASVREGVREEMLRRRRHILAQVTALHDDELETLDVLFKLDHGSRLELSRINDTIERIDSGQYGICADCGAKIDARRLRTLPHADTCIRCAHARGLKYGAC